MSATTSPCCGNSSEMGFGVGTRRSMLSIAVIFIGVLSLPLQLDVFVGGRERVARNQAEAGFLDARPHTVQERELVDRREHRTLVHELLDALEDRLTLAAIQLARLLAEEAVEVGIPAVREHPARHDELAEPRRGVAGDGGDDLDQVLQLLLRDALVERGALDRAQPRANPDGLEIAD